MQDIGKLILRLGMGGFMITHGWPKLMKLFAAGPIEFGDPIGLGPTLSLILTVFAEFVCSILLIVGFKTKWAAIPLAFTMLVAAFVVHGDDPFSRQEKALMYAVAYIVIALIGAGKYSLDGKLGKFQV